MPAEKYRALIRSGDLYKGDDIAKAMAAFHEFLRGSGKVYALYRDQHLVTGKPLITAREANGGGLLCVLYGVAVDDWLAAYPEQSS